MSSGQWQRIVETFFFFFQQITKKKHIIWYKITYISLLSFKLHLTVQIGMKFQSKKFFLIILGVLQWFI